MVCRRSSSIGTGLVVCCLTLVLSKSKKASSGPGESGGVAMTFDPVAAKLSKACEDARTHPSLFSLSQPSSSSSSSPSSPSPHLLGFPCSFYTRCPRGHTIADTFSGIVIIMRVLILSVAFSLTDAAVPRLLAVLFPSLSIRHSRWSRRGAGQPAQGETLLKMFAA